MIITKIIKVQELQEDDNEVYDTTPLQRTGHG